MQGILPGQIYFVASPEKFSHPTPQYPYTVYISMFDGGGGQNFSTQTLRGGQIFSEHVSMEGNILVHAIFGNGPTHPHP